MENTTLQFVTGGHTHTRDKERNSLLHLVQAPAHAREDSSLRFWRFHYYLGFWVQKTLLLVSSVTCFPTISCS